MSARLFSIKDDSVLKELYSRFTNKQLVQVFNGQFSISQIKNRGKDLGLHKDSDVKNLAQKTRSGVWEDWENEVIRKHYNKKGLAYVQNLLSNRTLNSIKNRASRMHIIVSHDIRNFANGPKRYSDVSKNKMSDSRIGKPFSEIHKLNMRLSARRGVDHPQWKGGIARSPYGDEFGIELKAKIKKRDHYQCQKCKKKPSWTKLVIHHISYDKQDSKDKNLITLCKSCHTHHHLCLKHDEQVAEQISFNNYIGEKYIVV
jgi:hypothetical protein